MSGGGSSLRPLDTTLVRVVLLMRILGWVWLVVLGVVALATRVDINDSLIVASMVVATVGTAMTIMAGRRGFLGNLWYVAVDGLVTVLLALAGPLAEVGDFVAGGYPASWLFIVAYATNMRVTAIVGAIAGLLFAVMHVVMDLGATRAYGSIQYLVIAVVVGWGFDALRRQEWLRIEAETQRETARTELAEEQARAARLEERSQIAIRLHDSVLQTLKLIRSSAEDASEVRYLARAQERDLRRTISAYESPHEDSFRARLLDTQADIEDMYRMEIDQVVKDDTEMDETLELVVSLARDVLARAVSDDGAERADMFTEVRDGTAEVSIRTFPTKGATNALSRHIADQIESLEGVVTVSNAPGNSREVVVRLRR